MKKIWMTVILLMIPITGFGQENCKDSSTVLARELSDLVDDLGQIMLALEEKSRLSESLMRTFPDLENQAKVKAIKEVFPELGQYSAPLFLMALSDPAPEVKLAALDVLKGRRELMIAVADYLRQQGGKASTPHPDSPPRQPASKGSV